MDQEKLKARLAKLLALAERGEGGEKDNAARMLQATLKKHGMTMEDIAGEKKRSVIFTYRTAEEKVLIHYVIQQATGSKETPVYRYRGTKKLSAELTAAEEIEATMAYDTYRKALAKHLEEAITTATMAFIYRNKIYAKTDDEDAKQHPLTPEQKEWARKVAAAMADIRPTPVNKAIEHKGATHEQ